MIETNFSGISICVENPLSYSKNILITNEYSDPNGCTTRIGGEYFLIVDTDQYDRILDFLGSKARTRRLTRNGKVWIVKEDKLPIIRSLFPAAVTNIVDFSDN